jgi:hypothetical protein
MPTTKTGDPVLIEPNAEQQQRSMQAAEAPAAPKAGVSLGAFLAGEALFLCMQLNCMQVLAKHHTHDFTIHG